MPTATLCPTQHWKSFIKITQKPWESSFRSSLTTLPVGGNHNSKQWDGQRWKRDENPARERFHRDFIITWQVRQTLATYPSKSPASILSSTSAQMRLTTRRSTQRQQVYLHASAGSASALVFHSWKWMYQMFRAINSFSGHLVSLVLFLFTSHPPPPLSPPRFRCSLPSTPGAEKAQLFTLRTAKALAMTVVDVVCCPALLQRVKDDFRLAQLKTGETSGEQWRNLGAATKTTTFIGSDRAKIIYL